MSPLVIGLHDPVKWNGSAELDKTGFELFSITYAKF